MARRRGGGWAGRALRACSFVAVWAAGTVSLSALADPSAGLPPAPSVAPGPLAPARPVGSGAPTRNGPGPAAPGADVHHGPGGETDANVCAISASVGLAHCDARVRTDPQAAQHKPAPPAPNGSARNPAGGSAVLGNNGAYDPSYLQSAYSDQGGGGSLGAGQTVAIVDAYDDPTASQDLAFYRKYFGLPVCPSASIPSSGKVPTGTAGCTFYKVNQSGVSGSYPTPDAGWATEISLDLDMVSAMCPSCQILLVEATTNNMSDLGTAVNRAVQLGASAVSNSYGASEYSTETSDDTSYYKHAGVPVVVSSGDSGYGVEFPAASQYVTAVGGTSLFQTTNNGGRTPGPTTEVAWSGAGSGCSLYEKQPSWQSGVPLGCSNRVVADVSAVADPSTGVWVYDSYQSTCTGSSTDSNPSNLSCFAIYGGTSVAAPIVSSVYALAHDAPGTTYPASYPYSSATSSLTDVTSGSNAAGPGLYSVSCPATNFCAAADILGNVLVSTGPTSKVWTVVPVDSASNVDAISCPSASFCAGVDSYGGFFYSTSPVTGSWTKSTIDGGQGLISLSCPTDGFCVAVDDNGGVVTVSTATNPVKATAKQADVSGGYPAYMSGVSCPPGSGSGSSWSGTCVAVDFNSDAQLLNISGGSLTSYSQPTLVNDVGGSYYALEAVSCATSTQCVAVDDNGDAVSIVVSKGAISSGTPAVLVNYNYMDGISCWATSTTNQCVAVDDIGNAYTITQTGSGLTYTSTSIDGTNWMEAVSCVGAGALCVAVDSNGNLVSRAPYTSPWSSAQAEPGCNPTFLCVAQTGYDGPTGLGTPIGTTAFASGPLSILTTSLPAGMVGTAYSVQLQAGGGSPPYTWSTSGGSLPPGLTLAPTGAITGTSTTNSGSPFAFTVQVVDSQGGVATQNLSITVNPAPAKLAIVTTSCTASRGQKFSCPLSATGGKSPYTWKATGGLPPGVSLSSAGLLSGTPKNRTTYNIGVKVTDSSSPAQTATGTVKLIVN